MTEKTREREKEKDSKKVEEYEEDDDQEKESYFNEDYESECPDCGSEDLEFDEKHGEISCRECNSVFKEDKIDRGPEWRAFNSEEMDNKSRVGSPTTKTMHDKGLTTKIDWKDKDAGGRSLSPQKRNQMNRLRKRNQRSKTKDPKDKNLQFALSEIDRMCDSLGLKENIREVASVIYRRALDADLIRGRSVEAVAASAIYIAAKKRNLPRSLGEVTEYSRIEEKEIGRTKRHVSRELGLKVEPSNPKDYVPRFCSELDLSNKVENTARRIIETSVEKGLLSGKSPTGFAAAAIYTASLIEDEDRTQKEVAEVANVTEVTIRNQCEEHRRSIMEDSKLKNKEDEEENSEELESDIDPDNLVD